MSKGLQTADLAYEVFIFAPIGRDAALTRDLLNHASIGSRICSSIAELTEALTTPAVGAVLMTEEALDDPDFPALVACLDQQPAWSDVPVLLFAGSPGSGIGVRAIQSIDTLRNVTLLERPIRLATVLTTVRAVLRGRSRQYEVRDLLAALDRARTEAETANRLKDDFLATLSHELRTPLNAILGWTSMLAHGQVEPHRFPQVFETLDRNAQVQTQLIADVLDVSRIITGKLRLRSTIVDLCDIVLRAVDAVRPPATAKNIRVSVDEGRDGLVQGDPDRLQQVFWNLLSNAIKFTPAGGSVSVRISREANTIAVAVVDSGAGIAPEFVPFVFDRFRQADQTTTRAHGGLGLGLAIVKHLTELHGGTVVAASDGLERGARFEVRLPAVAVDARVPENASVSVELTDLDGRSILIVDDDQSTREVVAAALEAAHAHVRVAISSADARQRIREELPALIVADLGMPVEDGFSFIRSVRQAGVRDVPAIALSAYADQQSRETALAAGFDAFLAKPTRAETLVQLVGTLLGHRQRGT